MSQRKISLGLIFTCISAVLALLGCIFYVINTKTNYFAGNGVSTPVIACLAIAIVCMVVYVIIGMRGTPVWADILPVASSALLISGLMNFASARINGIAAVMTFENNAQNMADLKSAIIGMVLVGIAAVVSIIAAFFDVTVEK
ncbi:MAG: hypothetical protein K6F00_09835 [Lachnospiraceae bacterium]|nr:hypothetical protein [Lachnospiraceae bacterium]